MWQTIEKNGHCIVCRKCQTIEKKGHSIACGKFQTIENKAHSIKSRVHAALPLCSEKEPSNQVMLKKDSVKGNQFLGPETGP